MPKAHCIHALYMSSIVMLGQTVNRPVGLKYCPISLNVVLIKG